MLSDINPYALRLKKEPTLDDLASIRINGIHAVFHSHDIKSKTAYAQSRVTWAQSRGRRYAIMEILRFCESTARLSPNNYNSYPKLNLITTILTQERSTWFFDELMERDDSQSIVLPILAQALFERLKVAPSRLLLITNKYDNSKELALVVNMPYENELAYFTLKSGHFFRLEKGSFELNREDFEIKSTLDAKQNLKSGDSFSILNYNNEENTYTISGRSECDRRHKKEDKLIQKADMDDKVPIELFFHPYYRAFGHTTIRIGSSMYELGTSGWKAHKPPQNAARAFIFNNPFFKSQFSRYGLKWISPFSIGTTLLISKKILVEIQSALDELCANAHRLQFNIVLNNCNQGIVSLLNKKGLTEVQPGGYKAFSSILSFRSFLYDNSFETEKKRIYILPGEDMTASTMRSMFPQFLYRTNSIKKEIKRGWPIYAVDLLAGLSNAVLKPFKKDPVKSTSPETENSHRVG